MQVYTFGKKDLHVHCSTCYLLTQTNMFIFKYCHAIVQCFLHSLHLQCPDKSHRTILLPRHHVTATAAAAVPAAGAPMPSKQYYLLIRPYYAIDNVYLDCLCI